ncbi:serine/threonine-protein kinase [Tabrizicola sp.]|uniref:serine/threonine-protein kinase n=1 Tax=Tabrizicola sp. TaxID=2005166 RepID=UPI00261E964C|nr:serine/threonine-protein kinase [Tabrizicola sp.]MDM7930338.1 protein kinase [Tabrizicola sp.]
MAQQKAVEVPVEEIETLEDLVDELQPGTKLLKGQYTIVRYLNSGGFGITYLAKDSLDRNVVIKECFPSSFCRRSKTMVAARSRAHTAELRSVVQLFVREARHLSKIVHPNIVAVHQVFEDNGTAYMAIDYIDGLDLQQIIEGQTSIPKPAQIVAITEKLLAAVGFIHSNDMLHRDISPDNILIDQKGQPILIDFGAAREQASQKSRAMSALRVVKDGYSPQEFYIAGSEQGPWSDLYALGATLYHLITGEAPVNGQARLSALAEDRQDPYTPLAGRFEGYPPGFLEAIDHALQTLPRQRVQSAQEWLALFNSSIVLSGSKLDQIDAAVHAMVVDSQVETIVQSAPGANAVEKSDFGAPPQLARKISQQQPAAKSKRGAGPVQVIGGVAAALALVGIGFVLMGGKDTPPPAASAVQSAATEAAAAPTPVEPAPAVAETATASAAAAPAAAEPAPEPVTEVASAPEPTPEAIVTPTPAPEPVAETVAVTAETATVAPALPAPTGNLRANQIGFAAWDATMPFMEENRIIGGQRVAIVSRILPTSNLAEAGNWLAPGLLLYTVNGVDVQQSGNFTTAVLNAMRVDPDGKARVVVEYAGSSLERQTGLMTVPATRLVSLANGVNVRISTIEGEWKAVVMGVTAPNATQLRQGDILFRDKTTGLALSGPETLETIMKALVETGTTVTEFSIIRDNKLATAAMQLAVEAGQ